MAWGLGTPAIDNLMKFTNDKEKTYKKSYKLPDMPLPYPTPSTKRLPQLKHQTREKKPVDILSFVTECQGTACKDIYAILREKSTAYL